MHIPDGYLSPATCAVTFAIALPFWAIALRRVKRQLNTRRVPLLGVFSAFSFVLMMFNLPLPGGTTGHAVGMGIAAIVLGPWAGMLAISIAVFVQALFFGDGGLTTLAANCLNMAIAGVAVAYGVYRLSAGRSELGSPRRVIAAGLAGYVAINVAALLAAIEFGVQPLWFRATDGTPLYAPYPLAIAIPAMMLGHLSVAGLAEALVSAGLVRHLQRHDPALLSATATHVEPAPGWLGARRLWAALGVLLVLTPLGLLASGGAWGEWGVDHFAQAPAGLERLATFWSAPLPNYAPSTLSAPLGYVLSALLGSGLLILFWALAGWITQRLRHTSAPSRWRNRSS